MRKGTTMRAPLKAKNLFLRLASLITIICPGSGATALFASPQQNGAYGIGWPAVHSDARNSDYSAVEGAKKVTLAWTRKFDGSINLGPTSNARGHVYVTTTAPGCHLCALRASTGDTMWCTNEVNKYAVASSALLDKEGRIFIADDAAMNALDENGKLLWKTSIVGFPLSAQFTPTGRLLFITHIGRIYVLDRNTGKPMLPPLDLIPDVADSSFDPVACMKGTEKCPCANTLAVDHRTGRFFFTFWAPGASQAALKAMLYTETPVPAITPLWTNDLLSGGSASSPDLSVDGKRVYVNDNVDTLHAIDAKTGAIIWKFPIGFKPEGSQSTSPKGFIMPAGGSDARLMCIADVGNRARLLWAADSLQNRGVATQAGGNVCYATIKTGPFQYDLVVVDVLSGRILDREKLPGTPLFSVGITVGYDGTVYVPTINGYLYAFKRRDGQNDNSPILTNR